jgi:hypothetical protein
MEAIILLVYVGVIIFNIMFIVKIWRMCNDVHTIMLKFTHQENRAKQETPNTKSESQQKSGSVAPLLIFCFISMLIVISLIILFTINPA